MAYVLVEDIRRYLNLPFCDDDLLLCDLEKTAEEVLAGHLNVKALSVYEDKDGDIPETIKTAIKTVVANLYQNRESISYAQPYRVPYTLEYILQPFKNYLKNIEE